MNTNKTQSEQLPQDAVMQSVLDASDLRVGNLVQKNYKLFKSEFKKVDALDIHFHLKHPELNTIGPIKLTEEWLLMFGFKKRSNPYKWYKWLYNDESEKLFLLWEKRELFNNNLIGYYCEEAIINMDHVHQLQNLYFALTGSELTVA